MENKPTVRSGFRGLLFGTAAAAINIAGAAENYSAWGRSADLIMDTSPAGANVPGQVINFPMLVRLTSADFPFSEARGKGQDIRFAKVDGTPLDYEIERWDSAQARAEVWVKVDLIAGNKAGQIVKMFWGNATAADSSDGKAVFSTNQIGVWHMGGTGTGARANSAAGPAAVPSNYDGDESRTGIIGFADSLDGKDPGDYLDIGDGYQDFSAGFTFSVWAYPTAAGKYARFFELGNGENADNIMLTRDSTTDNIRFDNYISGSPVSKLQTGAAISLNQWQHFAVTVSGGNVKIFKNGVIIASGAMGNAFSGNQRTSNFIGKSGWAWDAYFQGMLDEPEITKVGRSDNWIKLCYQNQKSGQAFVVFKPTSVCVSNFKGPADMIADEGATVRLDGTADCTASLSWTALSGPAPRILDPESRTLIVTLPRVAADTAIVYRFAAAYGDSTFHDDVTVRVRNAIPDPVFTLPANPIWNGADTMAFRPSIANMAQMTAAGNAALHWTWTLKGMEADTAWLRDGLLLKKALAEGRLEVGLCLDNSGSPVCKSATVTVSNAAGGASSILRAETQASRFRAPMHSWHDANGRLSRARPSNRFAAEARQAP